MALLSLDRVSKQYVRGSRSTAVLRDVSLGLDAGDFVAIYGQRGSGKSTLLRIAAGMQQPDDGTVTFGGQDLAHLTTGALAHLHRRSIAWVDRAGPSGDVLSVFDYVALPLLGRGGSTLREARHAAERALDRVGAQLDAAARWATLADGERIQVALAHALVREPRLLVLDDPTAGLDVIDRERIGALLRTVADEARVAVLMAVPDAPAVLRAHDVRALSRGRLVAPPEPPPDRGTVVRFPRQERSG